MSFYLVPKLEEAMQRIAELERERDAARAALARAVPFVEIAAGRMTDDLEYLTAMGDDRSYRSHKEHIETARIILADPLGQQAAQEWQHLKTVAAHVLKVKADGWYFSDPELAAAVEALAALQQQPPAAGEGQG